MERHRIRRLKNIAYTNLEVMPPSCIQEDIEHRWEGGDELALTAP